MRRRGNAIAVLAAVLVLSSVLGPLGGGVQRAAAASGVTYTYDAAGWLALAH